jgi:ankyrin repeat protein
MALKDITKWLNGHSTHSWTLGELVLRGVGSKDEPKDFYTDHLTRAARFAERAVTIGTVVALGAAGVLTMGALGAVGGLIVAKLAGSFIGKLTGAAVEAVDNKFNPLALDARDYYGYTKLGRAVQKGNAEAVKSLLEKGADIEATIPSGYGSETIAEAAAFSTPEIKKLFEDAAAKKAAAAAAEPAPVVAPAVETRSPQ